MDLIPYQETATRVPRFANIYHTRQSIAALNRNHSYKSTRSQFTQLGPIQSISRADKAAK